MKTLMGDILRVCPSAHPNDEEKVALVSMASWSFSREERFALSLYSKRTNLGTERRRTYVQAKPKTDHRAIDEPDFNRIRVCVGGRFPRRSS